MVGARFDKEKCPRPIGLSRPTGIADGTRDIKEPPSSSRRRADAHRASALDGSSPAPTLQKAQIPGRVSVLFGAADGTRTRTVSLPGDFKFSILFGNVGILREFFGMLYWKNRTNKAKHLCNCLLFCWIYQLISHFSKAAFQKSISIVLEHVPESWRDVGGMPLKRHTGDFYSPVGNNLKITHLHWQFYIIQKGYFNEKSKILWAVFCWLSWSCKPYTVPKDDGWDGWCPGKEIDAAESSPALFD